jgi:hypothetical protein
MAGCLHNTTGKKSAAAEAWENQCKGNKYL